MTMRTLVEAKMKEEAPSLHRQLSTAGSLKQYLDELTDEAKDEMVSLSMMIAKEQGLDKEDNLLKRAGLLGSARQAAREIVLSEMVFPQDETYQQKQAGTTGSETTT